MKKVLLTALALVVSLSVYSFAAAPAAKQTATPAKQTQTAPAAKQAVAVPVSSDSGCSTLKFYGEGSIIGFSVSNEVPRGGGFRGNYGGTVGFFTLGSKIKIDENVFAKIALGYENYWGDKIFEGRTANELLDLLRIVEANINIKNLFEVEGLSAKLGRQYYGDEDSTILYIGIRRNNPLFAFNVPMIPVSGIPSFISSLDAATFYFKKDNIKANAVYGIFANNTFALSPDKTNGTLRGIDLKCSDLADNKIDIQAYLYNAEEVPIFTHKQYTIFGLKPTVKVEDLKASLEFAKNFGGKWVFEEADGEYSNLIKFDISYNLKDVGLTPRAMYFVFGSANKDQNTSKGFLTLGNYVPGLVKGNEVMDLDNMQIINIGADYKYKKYTFAVDFYSYGMRKSVEKGRHGYRESEIALDWKAKYAYTDNVDIFAAIGNFFANKSEYDASTAQVGVSFKF